MFLQSLEALRYEAPCYSMRNETARISETPCPCDLLHGVTGSHSYAVGNEIMQVPTTSEPLNGRLGVKPKAKRLCSSIAHQLARERGDDVLWR